MEQKKKPKQSKYHNKKVLYDDIWFDSMRERDRYIQLKLMEKANMIHDLKLQVPFILQDEFELNGEKIKPIIYKADFTYYDRADNYIVEDVKSEATKTKVYEIKKKMLMSRYEIKISEV
jgi:hypothetical protein